MAAPQPIIKEHATHLEGWIQRCNENHGDKCKVDPITERPPHHIPDWVIDCEDGCIVRGCSVPRYAALSYVWSSAATDNIGGEEAAEDRLVLRKDNLADFCCQGFLRSHILESMPVIIQDAINFVQLSGFRYLWVDSLCIVQHDDNTRDRVCLMKEIYSGAYFTIIAAGSTNGLYGNKDDDDRQFPHDNISAKHLHSKLLCSHWASRGWTFQEQLLSKRSIIFLDDVCFWDCQREVLWPRSSTDEDTESSMQMDSLAQVQQPSSSSPHKGPLKAVLERVKSKLSIRRKLQDLASLYAVVDVPRHISQPPLSIHHPFEKAALERVYRKLSSRGESQDLLTSLSPIPDFKFYIELVCRYSNRNLTYDQDVLPAFSGVLEALSRRSFRGGFICGLPALFLDSALLWQPLLKARRRSPVGTVTKIAPMAPLPSWSWAGWQCLVDPDSLRGGLDYMTRECAFYRVVPSRSGRISWRTWKLVDWSTTSDDRSLNPVDEPALLQSFKKVLEEPNHDSLPTGWTRDGIGAFVHASNPTVSYRYPLPTQDTTSATLADQITSLLCCTTKAATLRVRRVLVPHDRDTADWQSYMKASVAHTSVFETDLYNLKPELHDFCPVITLEDKKGRWAGAMTVMENNASVQSGSELKMIAISTGSALQRDVAKSYPEMIDSRGYWRYGPLLEYYHFRPLDRRDACSLDNGAGSEKLSAADDTQRSLDAGIDVGPFAYPRRPGTSNESPAVRQTAPGGSNKPERYHFYNVLWVETIKGVMYRKAAGRVPKEIWELNCGEPTKIVLG